MIRHTLYDRKQWLFLLFGFVSCLFYTYLLLKSSAYGEATLSDLWLVCGAAGALSFLCVWYADKSKSQPSLFCVIGFALIFRVLGFWTFPVLEDDFYRYLWDGRATVEYGSPYNLAPSQFFADDTISETFETILNYINYPDVPTVYGSVLQGLFALSYWIAPAELWPLKIIIIFADVIIILLLAKKIKPQYLLLYAWCPLIIKEFSITAHPDIIGVMFMVLALFLQQRQYYVYAAAMLALAVASKIFAIVIVPLLLGFYWRRWLTFMSTAVLVALPFGVINAWIPGGLVAMGDSWLFNAPIYALLHMHVPFNFIKIALVLCFSLCWLVIFFRISFKQKPLEIRGDYIFALFFLCIPVLNPWYLIWLLPFAALYPSIWAWTASVAVLLSYASGINLNTQGLQLYEQTNSVLLIEFGFIALAVVIAYLSHLYRDTKSSQ